MTWSETHRRMDALRAIEAELDRAGDGRLPWLREYADIFGDRHTLLLQLRYRWRLMVEAQVEEPREAEASRRALAEAHPGLLAVLRRYASVLDSPEPEPVGVAR